MCFQRDYFEVEGGEGCREVSWKLVDVGKLERVAVPARFSPGQKIRHGGTV